MSFFGSRRHVEEPVPPTPEPIAPSTPLSIQQPIGFETVIGANATFEGNFSSSSNVRVDGTFTGTININGNVLVGETAKINADLHAKNISIAGAVRGNVHGKKVQLLRTGRVWGDINATALTTEEGAFIDGKISMVSADAAPAKVDPNTLVDEPSYMDQDDEASEFTDSLDEPEEMDGGIMMDAAEYYDDNSDQTDMADNADDVSDVENMNSTQYHDDEAPADTYDADRDQWNQNSWNQ
jgi:cytoskeletal protein CcmA (bactofilin family)